MGDQSKGNDAGECEYTVDGTELDVSSSSSGATLVNNYNSGSTLDGEVFSVGTTLVTWTASKEVDGTTYTNTCSYYVFVGDTTGPTITPPADITLYTSSSTNCYVYQALTTPSVSDNCAVSEITSNQSYYYPIGETNVVWRAWDIHGNLSEHTQKVTLIDDDAPSIGCPTTICRQVDNGETFYTVNGNEFGPYTNWDCSTPVTYVNDYNFTASLAGEQIPTGTYTIEWTATDAAGNINTCSSNVTINDDDPPAVTCRSNVTVGTDTDVCTYTVGSEDAQYDVVSTNPSPTLTLTHNIQTTTPGSPPYAPSNTTLAGAVFPKGSTPIVWTAQDGTDVNTCCTYSFSVYDNQAPNITWPSNITVDADEGGCEATGVDIGTPSGIDNCDISDDISYSHYPSGTTFSIGTTTIHWRAQDVRGNLTTHEQTITVVDNIDPVIACPSGTYYREYDNEYVDYYTIYGSEFTPSVSDNCYLSSYLNSKNNSRYLNGYQLDLGDHAITWTATDASSNTDQCVVNVTVVETFEPIIECPDDFLEYTSEEDCYYTVSGTGLDAVFASETTIPGRTLTHDFISAPDSITLNGAEIPEGETTITWTAKQTIGGTEYTSTCSHLITIIDDVDPVIVQPVHDTFNIDPGECSTGNDC